MSAKRIAATEARNWLTELLWNEAVASAEAHSPGWTTVKGVDVLASPSCPNIVAVPVTGRKIAARFDVINVASGELLCQLRKSEVHTWLFRHARAMEIEFSMPVVGEDVPVVAVNNQMDLFADA